MKNARPVSQPSASDKADSIKLTPRQERLLRNLKGGPKGVRYLAGIVGANNIPEVIRQLRCKGFHLPCSRFGVHDRDGKVCHPGRYRLTDEDRQKLSVVLQGEGEE